MTLCLSPLKRPKAFDGKSFLHSKYIFDAIAVMSAETKRLYVRMGKWCCVTLRFVFSGSWGSLRYIFNTIHSMFHTVVLPKEARDSVVSGQGEN